MIDILSRITETTMKRKIRLILKEWLQACWILRKE